MLPIDRINTVYKTHRQYNQFFDKKSDEDERLFKILFNLLLLLEFFLNATILSFILFCIFVNEKLFLWNLL